MAFLPLTREEMKNRDWHYVDFILVTGDAYVDHPSFGVAIIARVLEKEGFRIGIIAQPDIYRAEDFGEFGRPRYGFMVTSGNVDSMVAHYTAAKRRRSRDDYSPGGRAGKRPDRAVIVYSRCIREIYGDIPIVIGGLEASLRRFVHYDYWDDKVRASILFDSGADLLSYGMGEKQAVLIAARLAGGEKISQLTDIDGTCYIADKADGLQGILLPSYEKAAKDKPSYARSCKIQHDEQDSVRGRRLIQAHGDRYLVQNPPMPPLTQKELDTVYSLPFERYYHPAYESKGGVPAIQEVEFSIIHNRGCFGDCNFCSLAFHQGRMVTARSKQSVLAEAENLVKNPRFKGYIHDVGGPTANFRKPSCEKQKKHGLCAGKKCLAPHPCGSLISDHREYLEILRGMRAIKGIKKVFIRSGLRYDYILRDQDEVFLKELIANHISGQLKVAPEHCSSSVLDCMGKPHIESYNTFANRFYELTKSMGKKQYLVPYLMSSHPGSTLQDAVELAVFLKKGNIRPEQVQDFYPTPGTLSTCMFYTGINPVTMKPVYVAKTGEEKDLQRALLQYYKPENRQKVITALKRAGRTDLIGYGPQCLVKPDRWDTKSRTAHKKNRGTGEWRGGRK